MLETLISHQIVQLTNVCIVAKGKVLLLILSAKSKLSSAGHRLLQFCQWTLNSGAGVGTDKIRGLNRLLSSWVHHWLVRCVPISWSGGQKPDAVSFPSWPCFGSAGHVLFWKRFSSWCYWKWSQNRACRGDARSPPSFVPQLPGTTFHGPWVHLQEIPSVKQRAAYKAKTDS